MTVFVWTQKSHQKPDAMSKDEFSTSWAEPTARCMLCDGIFENGDYVWHWHVDGAQRRPV